MIARGTRVLYGLGTVVMILVAALFYANINLGTEKNGWQLLDLSSLQEGENFGQLGGIKFYRDQKMKQIYIADGINGRLIFAAEKMTVSIPHVYPFPNNPDRYFVWLEEEGATDRAQEAENTKHLLLVERDGTYREIKDIPQPGVGSYELSWSPLGEKAYLLLEGAEDHQWIIGILDYEKNQFLPLDGEITKKSADPESVVGMVESLTAVWLDDNIILTFDGNSHTFRNIDTSSHEVKVLPIKFDSLPEQLHVKKLQDLPGVPDMAVVHAGQQIYDVSFHGSERIFLLDLKKKDILQIGSVADLPDWVQYDQYSIGIGADGRLLIAEIWSEDKKIAEEGSYMLQFGAWDLSSSKYNRLFANRFAEMIMINPYTLYFSADRKYVAVRIQGIRAEYLYAFDTETGNRRYSKAVNYENGTIGSFHWLQRHKLQVGEEVIDLSEKGL